MYEGRYVVLHIDSNDMKFSCDFGSIKLPSSLSVVI